MLTPQLSQTPGAVRYQTFGLGPPDDAPRDRPHLCHVRRVAVAAGLHRDPLHGHRRFIQHPHVECAVRVGLRQPGKKVEVHTIDCLSLANGVDSDWLDLSWGDRTTGAVGRLRLVSIDT